MYLIQKEIIEDSGRQKVLNVLKLKSENKQTIPQGTKGTFAIPALFTK